MFKNYKWDILTFLSIGISILIYALNIIDDATINNILIYAPILILTLKCVISKPEILLKLQSRSIATADLKVTFQYTELFLEDINDYEKLLQYIVEKDSNILKNNHGEFSFNSSLVVKNNPIDISYDRNNKDINIQMHSNIKYRDFYKEIEELFSKIGDFFKNTSFSKKDEIIQINIEFEKYNPFIEKLLKKFHVKQDVTIKYKKSKTIFNIGYKNIKIYSEDKLKDLDKYIKKEFFIFKN